MRGNRGASKRGNENLKKKRILFPKKTFLALLGLGLVYLLIANSQVLYDKVNEQKIERLVIEGSLDYVSEEEIKNAAFRFIDLSMVAVDLDAIKKELENNPWISSVGLQREWPATLIIDVFEEMAIARWGDHQLLNQEGQLFSPTTVLNQTHLPYLFGPIDTEQNVMEQYQQFNQLLYPLGLNIASLGLNSRDAWTLELDSGVDIKVGNNSMLKRMRRFVDSIDAMNIENLEDINSIDLRYNNGIAISKKIETIEDVVSL
jgi:cell division protein FtsQ